MYPLLFKVLMPAIVMCLALSFSGCQWVQFGSGLPEICKPLTHSDRQNTKTVVFVHGFTGTCQETWGKFPALIYGDPKLGDFDVFIWSYPSGILGKQPSFDQVGEQLKTFLNHRLEKYEDVYFVGHSLGGLVIQSMVVQELENGHSQNLSRIKHIVFFGTPLRGMKLDKFIQTLKPEYANVDFTSDQIDELLVKWNEHVYKPDITEGDRDYKRKIPFTPVVGLQDRLVDEKSGRSLYPALMESVPGNHVEMKLPPDRDSDAYLVVKRRLLEGNLIWRPFDIHKRTGGLLSPYKANWTDIFWLNPEQGWLSGIVEGGGGGDDVGSGVLLRTASAGQSWSEVEKTNFNSGEGEFTWGPYGTYVWKWHEVGPITSILFYKGVGGSNVQGWLSSYTGVYASNDGGEHWGRKTPRPDHPDRQRYAHFSRITSIEGFHEIYAVGWQGIAHWPSENGNWELQMPTYCYAIGSIFVGSDREIFAVGHAPNDCKRTNQGALYYLAPRSHKWEIMPVTGIDLLEDQSYTDILLTDYYTAFVIGQKGLILKGIRSKTGKWVWGKASSNTDETLTSITYADHTLWIVGGGGVILKSTDEGENWTKLPVARDEKGKPINLNRIRFSEETGWIAGNGMVMKSEQK